jgi:hypothetical protein
VHHIEHAHADFSRFWREPWRGAQCGGGIGHPLLPARVHRPPAELIVLRRALRFERAIDELDDVHLGDAAERVKPLGLFSPCDVLWQQLGHAAVGAVISSQKLRRRATRVFGALPAMIAALIAPIEIPATQSGRYSDEASASYTPAW